MSFVIERFHLGDRRDHLPVQAGDVLLARSYPLTIPDRFILLGQRMRLPKPYAYWTHTAIIIGSTTIVEADEHGIHTSPLANYDGSDHALIHVGDDLLDAVDRQQVVAFATAICGEPYGFVILACGILWALVGAKFDIGLEGHEVCSGATGRCLERGSIIWRDAKGRVLDARHLAPGHIAQWAGVIA